MDDSKKRTQTPPPDDTLVFVLAGGQGRRLRPLTEGRPKPTLPFAGNARVIDFTLANCARSGLTDVHVLGQYRSAQLRTHLQRRWGSVGLRTPGPETTPGDAYLGTAHAVACNLDVVETQGARTVLVAAADHVYGMDYAGLLRAHRSSGAAVTVAGIEVDLEDASRFGVMKIDGDSRITAFEEKPASPSPLPGRRDRALASMGIYVFAAEVLRRWLGNGAGERHRDFGGDVLPALVTAGERVHAHVFAHADSGERGFWRDIGSVHSYWRTSLEMVHPDSPHRIASGQGARPGCGCRSCGGRLEDGNVLMNTVISCGAPIRKARIERSVLCCGVAVGEGVVIEDSVVLEGARIGRGTRLRGVVVDRGADIPPGVTLQSRHPDPWGGGPQALAGVVPGPPGRCADARPPSTGHCGSGDCSDGCGCADWGTVSPQALGDRYDEGRPARH